MTFVKTALFHKAGEGSGGGGGGGDQHNLGWYATEAALESAHPTASNGDWAIVGATDTVWVWDSDSTGWKDTGAAGIELPDQTGHSGEFLTTDGSSASWSDKPLVNTSTAASSIAIGGISVTSADSIAIGTTGSVAGIHSVSVSGAITSGGSLGVAIGQASYVSASSGTALGQNARVTGKSGISIGSGTASAERAYQIGYGTNSTAHSLSVGTYHNNTGKNYQLLDLTDGTIPTARFTTDPAADGTYYPTLTISSGTPTRSWSTISALVNRATGTNSLAIGNNSTTASLANSVIIGYDSYTNGGSGSSVAIGKGVSVYTESVSIGSTSSANGYGAIAIGSNSKALATRAIQIGYGLNSESGTLYVGLYHNSQFPNYKLLDSDGTVPTARLTKVNSTITLTAAGWSGGSQTVTVTGMTATGVVLVSPDPTDQSAYTSAGIICTAQAADSLTFTCSTTPSADIDVSVVML